MQQSTFLAAVFVTLAIGFTGPRAEAIQLNLGCRDAANAILSGDDTLQGTVVGISIGAAGMLGDLLCFVGDRRCNCMRNATDSNRSQSDTFANQLGTVMAGCRNSAPNRSLSGIAQEAVLNVCR